MNGTISVTRLKDGQIVIRTYTNKTGSEYFEHRSTAEYARRVAIEILNNCEIADIYSKQ